MPPVIGLVTDSSSQIPADLVERFQVEVVPMTVTIDGVDFLEGDRANGSETGPGSSPEHLDADGFYRHFADGATPEISTSQPSPGRFVEAYRRLAERGCTDIVSIHLAETMSGTIASARIAASSVPAAVHIIDTGSASYGVSVCVWSAGVAVARGGLPSDIERRIGDLVPRIGTAFMVGVPQLTERGGRAAAIDLDGEGIPILAMAGGTLEVLDRVTTIDDAIDVMSTYATGWIDRVGGSVTVAIGTADEPSRPLAGRLRVALTGLPHVDGLVDYRIGPSIGAHTGPGTFGLFVFPTIR